MPQIELKGKVSLDGSGFDRVLAGMRKHGQKFASDLKSQVASVFTVAATIQMARALTDHVERIKDMSEQYQVTTKEVQQMDIAMAKTGLRFEDFGAGLIKFGELRRKAGEGDKDAQNFLARFGIFVEDIQNPLLRNIDLALRFADALQKLPITAQQAAMGEGFGVKSGSKMLESLREFQKIRDENDESLLVDKKDLDLLDAAIKKLEVLTLRAKAFAATSAADVMTSPGSVPWQYPSLIIPWMAMRFARRKAGKKQPTGINLPFAEMSAASDEADLFEDKEGKRILKETAELMEKIDKIGRGLLSNTAKREQLEKQIAMHLRNAEVMADATDTAGKELALEEKQRAAELLGELAGTPIDRVKINANELQRIGGFAGAHADEAPRTTKLILNEVRKVAKNTTPKVGAEPF